MDFNAAAVAQGAANEKTAIVQSHLSNPNVVNPYGTQRYRDPKNPRKDRPTLVQRFGPEQQGLFDQNMRLKGLLGGLGLQGARNLKGVIGKKLDLSGAPDAPGSYDETRQRVIDAMMSRTNEDYAKSTDTANSDLIAAGISPGTKAYGDKMQMIERSRNDARQQAEIAGGNAASQAYGMDAQSRKDSIAEILAQRQMPLNEISALMSGSQVSNPFSSPGYSPTQVGQTPVFGGAQAQYGANADSFNAQAANAARMQQGAVTLGAAGLGAWGTAAAAGAMF